jgi:hypothetical protein
LIPLCGCQRLSGKSRCCGYVGHLVSHMHCLTHNYIQTLNHPNIVRLCDVIETDKFIGIILEYVSGGELFDHILAHRNLKEKDAAKFFSVANRFEDGSDYLMQTSSGSPCYAAPELFISEGPYVGWTLEGYCRRLLNRGLRPLEMRTGCCVIQWSCSDGVDSSPLACTSNGLEMYGVEPKHQRSQEMEKIPGGHRCRLLFDG